MKLYYNLKKHIFKKRELNFKKKRERGIKQNGHIDLIFPFSIMFQHNKEDSHLLNRNMVLPRIQIYRYFDVELLSH